MAFILLFPEKDQVDISLEERLQNVATTFMNPFIIIVYDTIAWPIINVIQTKYNIPCYLAYSLSQASEVIVSKERFV